MKKIIFVLFLGMLFIVACEPNQEDTVSKDRDDTEPVDDNLGFSGISEAQCREAGGHWNECGSPCAGTGADFCIEKCQVQCECSGIAGFSCPEGFKCRLSGQIADEMGVCIPE